MVDARKQRFDAETAWELLRDALTFTTAKGKKTHTWDPNKDDKETILSHVMGPSGNLRVPTFYFKNTFIIGFNADLYDKWMQKL